MHSYESRNTKVQRAVRLQLLEYLGIIQVAWVSFHHRGTSLPERGRERMWDSKEMSEVVEWSKAEAKARILSTEEMFLSKFVSICLFQKGKWNSSFSINISISINNNFFLN